NDAQADGAILRKYGLASGAYLFLPGHSWLHKNHKAALAALAILRDRHNVRLRLVLTGAESGPPSATHEQIAANGLGQQVTFLGYCPRKEMPALYRGSICLVFPSLFEGFGMPVLEAMASGCPVVCSNSTSLPEIAGNAAWMVDPHDHESLAQAI